MGRTFTIGDIHGGYKALKQVLDRSSFDYENDALISLGDLCDGWSETKNVIDELMKIKNLVLIRGNHDEWTLQGISSLYYEQLKDDKDVKHIIKKWYVPNFFMSTGTAWNAHGGKATHESFDAAGLDYIKKALKFLHAAEIFWIQDDKFFCHAGFDPDHPPTKSERWELLSEGFYYWDRRFWQMAYSGRNPGKAFKEVYIGHTPTLNFQCKDDNTKPLVRRNVYNMDTGACFYGKLSMMDINTKELFQSDVVRELYPKESGRMSVTFEQEPRHKSRYVFR